MKELNDDMYTFVTAKQDVFFEKKHEVAINNSSNFYHGLLFFFYYRCHNSLIIKFMIFILKEKTKVQACEIYVYVKFIYIKILI